MFPPASPAHPNHKLPADTQTGIAAISLTEQMIGKFDAEWPESTATPLANGLSSFAAKDGNRPGRSCHVHLCRPPQTSPHPPQLHARRTPRKSSPHPTHTPHTPHIPHPSHIPHTAHPQPEPSQPRNRTSLLLSSHTHPPSPPSPHPPHTSTHTSTPHIPTHTPTLDRTLCAEYATCGGSTRL